MAKEQKWQCWDSRSLHTRTISGMGSRAPGSLGPSPPGNTQPCPCSHPKLCLVLASPRPHLPLLPRTAPVPLGWILPIQPLSCGVTSLLTSLDEAPSQSHPRTRMGLPCPALPCAITGRGGRDSTGTSPGSHSCPLCGPCPGTVRPRALSTSQPRGSGLGFHLPAPLSSPLPVSCLHFLLPPSSAHADEPHAGAHPRAHRLLMRL